MKRIDISFAGCGFLAMYHVGVLKCIQETGVKVSISRSLGASAGSVVACLALIDYPASELRSKFLRIVDEARTHPVGAFHPKFDVGEIFKKELYPELPSNVAELVNGRLYVSLTTTKGRNVLISEFKSRGEVVDALTCSCFLPAFSGYTTPTFNNVKYLDGGMSNNLPALDANTILVSPLSGLEKHICPSEKETWSVELTSLRPQLTLFTTNTVTADTGMPISSSVASSSLNSSLNRSGNWNPKQLIQPKIESTIDSIVNNMIYSNIHYTYMVLIRSLFSFTKWYPWLYFCIFQSAQLLSAIEMI